MCNINVLITNKQKFSNQQISSYVGAVANSYVYNNDGLGSYLVGSDKVVKSVNFLNFVDIHKHIKDDTMLFNHTRLTTSGWSAHNIQPFCKDDYVFLHNGVFTRFDENQKDSDTLQYFKRFLGYIKRGYDEVDAIKKMLAKEQGSYSIVLYNRKTKKMYYAKNCSTFIKFYKSKDLLFITTERSNDVFFEEKFKELIIKPFVLYEIIGTDVYSIDTLEQPTYTAPKTKNDKYYRRYSDYDYVDYAVADIYDELDEVIDEIDSKEADYLIHTKTQ